MKTMKLLLSLILFFSFVSASSTVTKCQTASWKDIKVVVSTRNDVRRILGQQDEGRGFEIYSVKDGTIDVDYSYGKCSDDYNSGWNIAEDIVVEFSFTPLREIQFSKLKADVSKFEKIQESPHVPELVTYRNSEEGVRYVVDRTNGRLRTIAFFPPARYDKLRCVTKKN